MWHIQGMNASSVETADEETSTAEVVLPQSDAGCPRCRDLEAEVEELRWSVARWRGYHQRAVDRERQLKKDIKELKAKIRLRERQLFERNSELQKKDFGNKANDRTTQPKRNRGQQPGSKGHGRRRHEHLPAVEEIVDVSDDDKLCPTCHEPLAQFPSTDDSEVVEIEVKAHRRVIRRKRYRRTCRCPDVPVIVTAPSPPKLIPKGAFGVSFWTLVFIDKFLFQRPTFRLLTDLRLTHNLDVSPGTVTDGLKRLSPIFEPLYDEIRAKGIAQTRWHADETRWLVFAEVEGKVGNKWWLWVFHSPSTVFYKLDPSHSSSVPKDYFGDKAQGILNVDRHRSYKGFLKEGRIRLAFCWAHVRRDFLTVANDRPELRDWALAWLGEISALFQLNRQRLSDIDSPEAFSKAQAQLAEAVDQMERDWAEELLDAVLHPVCKRPLKSLKEHWPGLVLFVDHPEVPMDNNQAERDLRNPVVGRKNYYGSGARWSGQLAAMLFSVFQTLLVGSINPRRWLQDYLQACAEHGGNAPPNATRFLPWNLTEDEQRRYRILGPREVFDTS